MDQLDRVTKSLKTAAKANGFDIIGFSVDQMDDGTIKVWCSFKAITAEEQVDRFAEKNDLVRTVSASKPSDLGAARARLKELSKQAGLTGGELPSLASMRRQFMGEQMVGFDMSEIKEAKDMLLASLDTLPADDPEVADFKDMVQQFSQGIEMVSKAVERFKT